MMLRWFPNGALLCFGELQTQFNMQMWHSWRSWSVGWVALWKSLQILFEFVFWQWAELFVWLSMSDSDLQSSGVGHWNTALLLKMHTAPQSVIYHNQNKNPRLQQNISSSRVCWRLCNDGGLIEIESSHVYFSLWDVLVCGLMPSGQIRTFLWPTDLMTWFPCTSPRSNQLCVDVHPCGEWGCLNDQLMSNFACLCMCECSLP